MAFQVIKLSEFQIMQGSATEKFLAIFLIMALLPSLSLVTAFTFSPHLTYSYSVEDPTIGLSFAHGQAVEGDDLVGGYRVLLPGGRRKARQLDYRGTYSLKVGPLGQYTYSVNYRV